MDFQSNPQGEYGRFEQILAQFVLKSLHIILNLRVPSIRSYGGIEEVKRSDRWFNLVLGDRPAVLDNLNLLHRNLVEPVMIDIILVQDKAYISSEDNSGKAFAGSYTETVIERWVVQCENRRSMVPHMGDSSFKKTYKKSIILLRSLYSMLKLLPAFKAFRKLSLSSQSCCFNINFKVSSFSEPFSRAEEEMMKQFTFTSVDAQQGRLSLSVTYRENLVDFILETSASFPPEIITDYVGSPLTDLMRSFPLTSMDKGVPHTSFLLRTTQSSSSTPVQRPQSCTNGLFRAPSLPHPYVGSPPLYHAPYQFSTLVSDVYGQRVPPNYKFLTHQKASSCDDDQLSPPFSPSPSPSSPTYPSGANLVQTHLRSETGPVSVPHPLIGRTSRHLSPNLSDLNRSSRKIDLLRAPELDIGTTNPGEKDDLDNSEFSYHFIVDDVDTSDSRARSQPEADSGFRVYGCQVSIPVDWKEESFVVGFVIGLVKIRELQAVLPGVEKAENGMVCREDFGSRKGAEASSQVCATTRKSQDAAVDALIHMLRNAPPLRQDSSCNTTRKAEVEGETGSASQLYVPRKASDALEELKAYTQLKDMLLPKSTTRSGSEAGNLASCTYILVAKER